MRGWRSLFWIRCFSPTQGLAVGSLLNKGKSPVFTFSVGRRGKLGSSFTFTFSYIDFQLVRAVSHSLCFEAGSHNWSDLTGRALWGQAGHTSQGGRNFTPRWRPWFWSCFVSCFLKPWACANFWINFGLLLQHLFQLLHSPGSFPGGFVNEYNFTATKDRGRTESSGGKRALSFFPKSNFSSRNCFLRQARTHMGPDLANASLFPREVLNYPPTKTLVEVQEL